MKINGETNTQIERPFSCCDELTVCSLLVLVLVVLVQWLLTQEADSAGIQSGGDSAVLPLMVKRRGSRLQG